MKISIDMPHVQSCSISDCAYNVSNRCHARAITIGDGVNPGCDTAFLNAPLHTQDKRQIAGVGACKVSGCRYNDDLECNADSIEVGFVDKRINCLKYDIA